MVEIGGESVACPVCHQTVRANPRCELCGSPLPAPQMRAPFIPEAAPPGQPQRPPSPPPNFDQRIMPVDPRGAGTPPAAENWPFAPSPPGQWQPPHPPQQPPQTIMPVDPAAALPPADNWPFHQAPPGQWQPPRPPQPTDNWPFHPAPPGQWQPPRPPQPPPSAPRQTIMPVDPAAAAAQPADNWPFHPAPPGQWQPPRPQSPPQGTRPLPSLAQLAEQASAAFPKSLPVNVSQDTVMAAIRNCLALSFKIDGRTGRAEYWYFTIAALVATFLITAMAQAVDSPGLAAIVLLAVGVPNITSSVRRLHDIDRSGIWLLLGFVPLGVFVVLYWLAQPGQATGNSFGPPPASPT